MKMTLTKTEKPASVTILHLEGILDSTNYQSLIDEAQKVFDAGVRDLVLDLSKLTFISSAGLGALHQVALLFRGKKQAECDESWSAYRWAAFRALDSNHNRAYHKHVKLLSPTKEVMGVIEIIGFSSLFEIYTDIQQAVASFYQTVPAMKTRLP
jgi:anti-anti-sigma factor